MDPLGDFCPQDPLSPFAHSKYTTAVDATKNDEDDNHSCSAWSLRKIKCVKVRVLFEENKVLNLKCVEKCIYCQF